MTKLLGSSYANKMDDKHTGRNIWEALWNGKKGFFKIFFKEKQYLMGNFKIRIYYLALLFFFSVNCECTA